MYNSVSFDKNIRPSSTASEVLRIPLESISTQHRKLISVTTEKLAYSLISYHICITQHTFLCIWLLNSTQNVYEIVFPFCVMYHYFDWLSCCKQFHCMNMSPFIILADRHLGCYAPFALRNKTSMNIEYSFVNVHFHLSLLNAKKWNH